MIVNQLMDAGFSKTKIDIISSWIGCGKKVLDLGCYDGRHSEIIKNFGNQVYGVEALVDRAEEARKRGIEVAVLDLETEELPYADKFFDVVVAGDLIEHIFNTDGLIRKVNRVLKEGGQFIVTTPNLASLGRRALLLVGKNPFIEVSSNEFVNRGPVGHVKYFVKDTLVSLLVAGGGFKVTDITSDQLYLGLFGSTCLGRFFPTLSWRLIARAVKIGDLKE